MCCPELFPLCCQLPLLPDYSSYLPNLDNRQKLCNVALQLSFQKQGVSSQACPELVYGKRQGICMTPAVKNIITRITSNGIIVL